MPIYVPRYKIYETILCACLLEGEYSLGVREVWNDGEREVGNRGSKFSVVVYATMINTKLEVNSCFYEYI